MVDILLRGLPDEVVYLYEEEAKSRRSSRNEVMVQRLREHAPHSGSHRETSIEQWNNFFAATEELGSAEIMSDAWR